MLFNFKLSAEDVFFCTPIYGIPDGVAGQSVTSCKFLNVVMDLDWSRVYHSSTQQVVPWPPG